MDKQRREELRKLCDAAKVDVTIIEDADVEALRAMLRAPMVRVEIREGGV